MSEQGHCQLDHTADLALQLWAPTEPALLVEGARALMQILTGRNTVERHDRRPIELQTFDAEDRLVSFLNEVLYQATVHGFLTGDAELEVDQDGIRGVLLGEAGASNELQTEIKSATYHDLAIEHHGDGLRARVVLDV